ncbi:ABC transporter permease [Alkalihalobacillus oceani]|uniref:ABC transporter permease n=1 Tax=Halalkalibacter oceani TaxID=1653776 RepID=A0A9X2DLT7_9BACI|nr:ABC transporter permease [Halalkalibacter oceani]MCM3712623.1 ABC transporter permease [Halalkalibacter oceani]
MRNFWIIVGHTYTKKLLTKTFLVTTAITLLFVLFFMNMERIFTMFEQDAEQAATHIIVVDETDELIEPLRDQLQPFTERIILAGEAETLEEARQSVEAGDYDAALRISYDQQGQLEGEYFSDSLTQTFAPNQLQQALQHVKETRLTVELGLSPVELERIYQPISFELTTISETAKSESELMQAQMIVYVLLFVIYFTVLLFGNMIATEVVTEKSSRVMEILVSTVSPITQMFGKIVGIGLLALTQYGLLFLVGAVSLMMQADGSSLAGAFLSEELPLDLLGYAILFFLLGYFLYATLSATLGSIVSRVEDVNQVLGPVNFLVIGAFFLAMFGLNAPESTVVTVASFIPFFTPMLMFLRVGMLPVPLWEVILALVILLGTIAVLAAIGGRIFKGGVLMYGKSSALKDLKKAFQLSKQER